MNRLTVITASLLASVWSIQSFASSALYTFSAPIYASEVNLDGSSIADGDYLFDDSASITGTFSYDAATLATAVNQPPVIMGPLNLYSLYEGSIQSLSASVAGYSLSATSGATLINDAIGESGLDAVFIRAGTFNHGAVGNGFSGFTIGNYSLVSFDLFTFSLASSNSQALPSILSNGDQSLPAVSLIFADGNNNQRLVQFGLGNIELTEVPLPASAWLFGSAALVLVGRKRHRASL